MRQLYRIWVFNGFAGSRGVLLASICSCVVIFLSLILTMGFNMGFNT